MSPMPLLDEFFSLQRPILDTDAVGSRPLWVWGFPYACWPTGLGYPYLMAEILAMSQHFPCDLVAFYGVYFPKAYQLHPPVSPWSGTAYSTYLQQTLIYNDRPLSAPCHTAGSHQLSLSCHYIVSIMSWYVGKLHYLF